MVLRCFDEHIIELNDFLNGEVYFVYTNVIKCVYV